MSVPRQLADPLYRLLHAENIAAFNAQKPAKGEIDLAWGDFRGLNLRNLDASRVNFANAYFRGADLRGVDLREANLEGASLASAKISGVFFPADLAPEEIMMSVNFGTRLRYRSKSG